MQPPILYRGDTKTQALVAMNRLSPLETKMQLPILYRGDTKTQALTVSKPLSPLETKMQPPILYRGDTKLLRLMMTTQALHQQRAWTHSLEQHG